VGIGDPLEAAYRLPAPIPSGRWGLVGDGLIFESCDVRFDVLWRRATSEMPIASFSHHFDAPPDGLTRFDAVAYEDETDAGAVPAVAGDLLILRFTVVSIHPPGTRQYAPNGDGARAKGRIPFLRLP
jgi:hypothetical protein